MAKLSKAAIKLIEDAGFSEITDDYVIQGDTDLRILLSHRAVADLNAQAREQSEFEPERAQAQKGQ